MLISKKETILLNICFLALGLNFSGTNVNLVNLDSCKSLANKWGGNLPLSLFFVFISLLKHLRILEALYQGQPFIIKLSQDSKSLTGIVRFNWNEKKMSTLSRDNSFSTYPKFSEKTNISYTLICTRTCVYRG